MAVLVTGGAGYIGSHMALELLDHGELPVILDNLSAGFRWAAPEGAPFYEGDFGDADLLARIFREHAIDAIIHFAAKIVVPESVKDPIGYYQNNTAKACALIAAALKGGIKHFIFSSTAAVYGNPPVNPVPEDSVLAPVSPYGRSKLMVEWMLQDASRAHSLNHAILRYFNVAGADPKGRAGQSTAQATHLIKVASQAALGQRAALDVYGDDYDTPDGTCVRDYIHVSDLARAHWDALQRLRSDAGSFIVNCGYGRGYSVREVIDVVKSVAGVAFPVRVAPRRDGDPDAIVASNAKIMDLLEWRPRYDDLDVIVRSALDWERRLHNRSLG